jgi:metal-sulfur cluster biosynthetic enzyme
MLWSVLLTVQAASPSGTALSAEGEVLAALRRIIDPDFGMDIVACGFVKQLTTDRDSGRVSFALELTTPACPIKDEFERKARDYVSAIGWVTDVCAPLLITPPFFPLPAPDVTVINHSWTRL